MTRYLDIPRDRPHRSPWLVPVTGGLALLFLLSLHLMAPAPDQTASTTAHAPGTRATVTD